MKEVKPLACIPLIVLLTSLLVPAPVSATPIIVPHFAPHRNVVYAEVEVESVTDMKDGTWSIVGRDSDNVKTSYTSGDVVSGLPQPGDLIRLSTINNQVFSWRKLDKEERRQFRRDRKDYEYRRTHRDEIEQREKIETAVTLAVPGVILLVAGLLFLAFR